MRDAKPAGLELVSTSLLRARQMVLAVAAMVHTDSQQAEQQGHVLGEMPADLEQENISL